MVSWSWPAFILYVGAVSYMTLGGFVCLVKFDHPVFLAPIFMGLFFYYITWQIVAGDKPALPPGRRQR